MLFPYRMALRKHILLGPAQFLRLSIAG